MNTTTSSASLTHTLKRAAMPIALLLAAISGTAQADTAIKTLPTVTLQGSASLKATCPQAAEVLQEALESTVHRVREEGVMQVRFTLVGQQISDVQATAGPARYRARVRTAVADLKCQGQSQVAQQHQFAINFSDS